jgi:DNA-binding XRE family transcriptional regulator
MSDARTVVPFTGFAGSRRPTGPAPADGPEPLWRELVGAELRRRRRERDLTLADVAGRAGISVQYLSELERGRKEPSSEVLGAVHTALGLRLADLTGAVTEALRGGRGGANVAPDAPLCLAG